VSADVTSDNWDAPAPRTPPVLPSGRSTERDIQFSLRLDRLAASIEAAEAALRELRAEYDDLVAAQHESLDDTGVPRSQGEWLGHSLVERAMQLLHAPPGSPAD
jgi:hypothetical protein